MFENVIVTFTDGRLPFITPNNPVSIAQAQKMLGEVIEDIKPYDPNAKPVVLKYERTYTQAEVDLMMKRAANTQEPPVSTEGKKRGRKKKEAI